VITEDCDCGARVLIVDISDVETPVDEQPHSSGRIEVHYQNNGPVPYGRKLAHQEAPRAGRTRHRQHNCVRETP
jgi:hypothetical protein